MTTALTDFELVKIEDIVIGERYRKEPEKDLDKLVKSIEDVGLLNPVVITQAMELVAGHRRILACKKVGYDEIEAHYVHDLDEAARLLAEHDENVCRVQFTTGEARALYKQRQTVLKPLAEANTLANLSSGSRTQSEEKKIGRVRDAAAAGTGRSGETLERAEKIEKIANDPDEPEEVREVAKTNLDLIDNDKKGVRPALADVKRKQAEAKGSRGQSKALGSAIVALEKQALALETAFIGADNYDADVTVDDVRDSFKLIRAAITRINKVSKEIGQIG